MIALSGWNKCRTKMSDVLKDTFSIEGVPLLTYRNFKYVKSRRNVGGEIYWRCVNRKCRAHMTTEGQPGKRFIVDSDLNHNHESNENDEQTKPPEPLVSTTSKRKHDEGEVEPRKIWAARIEPVFCSSSIPKEKSGILKSWSFSRRKFETIDSSSSTSSDNGSKSDVGGIPKSDPPFPGTYLQYTDSSRHQEAEESHPRDLKRCAETLSANNKCRDEFDVAGWVYGNQLRSLDPQQRFITEKLVADVVFKARLKLLKITSRVE